MALQDTGEESHGNLLFNTISLFSSSFAIHSARVVSLADLFTGSLSIGRGKGLP